MRFKKQCLDDDNWCIYIYIYKYYMGMVELKSAVEDL